MARHPNEREWSCVVVKGLPKRSSLRNRVLHWAQVIDIARGAGVNRVGLMTR